MRRLSAVLAALAALAAALVLPVVALCSDGKPINPHSLKPLTLAVIGDTPYGEAQYLAFPGLIADVNADPEADLVLHVGDIKSGSTLCTDAYFAGIRAYFDAFADPVVYTPGDNEWIDCHRANNGGYHPLDRLAAIRSAFFPEPGTTIGGREKAVLTQADEPGYGEFVENQLWLQSRTAFSVVHVVGSNNDLQPWFGAAETPLQTAQRLADPLPGEDRLRGRT
ncbi:MAG TPA: metallophosphoesterase family protein [Gaiellaceae bacterium]|nr:metallophosphoesterase family protein [Gaiellaceae bacterium]